MKSSLFCKDFFNDPGCREYIKREIERIGRKNIVFPSCSSIWCLRKFWLISKGKLSEFERKNRPSCSASEFRSSRVSGNLKLAESYDGRVNEMGCRYEFWTVYRTTATTNGCVRWLVMRFPFPSWVGQPVIGIITRIAINFIEGFHRISRNWIYLAGSRLEVRNNTGNRVEQFTNVKFTLLLIVSRFEW